MMKMPITFNKVTHAQNLLYEACGFKATALIAENESKEYYAHYYTLEAKSIRFRISKITPTKSGQFVTMWKRMRDGTTGPYDQSDDVDFFIINIADGDKIGQFVFPKSVLVEKNIFSKNGKGGKRAIRVYSPWDTVHSIQAAQTKEWQNKYFLEITQDKSIDVSLAKKLYLM